MGSRAVAVRAPMRGRATSRSARAGRSARLGLLLLAPAAALTALGLVMVLSASSVSAYAEYGSSFLFFKRQALYAVVGSGALFLTSRMRYGAWQRLSGPLVVASALLLALVLVPGIGTVAGGSARWITAGPVTVQPSELAKLALVTYGAAVLARRRSAVGGSFREAVPFLLALGLVGALVMMQPDLGTTVILVGTGLLLLFVGGVRFRHVLAGALGAGGLGMAMIVTEGYRRARLLSFLNPWVDPRNTGYQVIQSLIALGSGGFFGVGLGASRQKWLYVPNAHTDFIFAILGEELGLLGAIVVLVLFGVLLVAGVRVAARAPDPFGRLLAAGVVAWLGIQALVNLGTVTGVLPVTGIPLPFVSFGGSSLVVTLAAVGILMSVARPSGGGVRGRVRGGVR